jgi:hypothetical protein
MLPAFRFPWIVVLLLAIVVGPARAQQAAPAVPPVTIDKTVIESGLSHTVKYFVSGGSPRLQAMVRSLEWAENEVTLIEQLQQLKLEIVVNERQTGSVRTLPQAGFGYSPGYRPVPVYGGSGGESSLRGALSGVIANEATPEAALQAFSLLEHVQTDLIRELLKLPPQEQQAMQAPIDALRTKVACLPRPAGLVSLSQARQFPRSR